MSRTAPLEAERAYTVKAAAEVKGVHPDTIRRAIRSTHPDFHLPAKQPSRPGSKSAGRGGYRILASDLDDWFRRLPDA